MAVRKYSTAKNILRFEGHDSQAYWKRFSMLLALSVVIATMGLLRNSGAVVIAAMLIAPLMSPILGLAASMVVGRLKRAFNLFLIVSLAAVLCAGLAWAMVFLAGVPRSVTLPEQVLSRTDPGIEDLIVALAAGVAGAYVQIQRSEIALLPGAAIGVSLVPPLAAAGVLIYFREYQDAYEAGLLFATNLCAIVLAACIVYIASAGVLTFLRQRQRRTRFTFGLFLTIVALGVVAFQLAVSTFNRFEETRLESLLAQRVQEWADPISVEIVRLDVKPRRKTADLWIVVDLPFEAASQVGSINRLLPDEVRERPLIEVVEQVLGPGFAFGLRFQTRIAGLVYSGTDFVTDAPTVEELTEE